MFRKINIRDEIDNNNRHVIGLAARDHARVRFITGGREATDTLDDETRGRLDEVMRGKKISSPTRKRVLELCNLDGGEETDDQEIEQDLKKSRAKEDEMIEEGSLRASDYGRDMFLRRNADDSRALGLAAAEEHSSGSPTPAAGGGGRSAQDLFLSRNLVDSRSIGGGS